jgi:hypothetical protein
MTVQNRTKPVEQIVAAIEALDLEPIKFKLMDREEGQGWSREYVERMAIAYRRFLTLLVTHPETTVAPTKDIDKFWHGHILDTMKYAEDCERVFGYFLHHFPYFGMRGGEDAAALSNAGQEMERLYVQEFGEEMPQSQAAATAPAYCMSSVSAKDAAYCMASRPSYCMATVVATDAAYCMATAQPKNSAYCMASKSSYCMASIGKPKDAAYCMASGQSKTAAAYCMASKPSYCMATAVPKEAAYCMASAQPTNSAYCMASKPSYCMASKQPDVQTRPSLANVE